MFAPQIVPTFSLLISYTASYDTSILDIILLLPFISSCDGVMLGAESDSRCRGSPRVIAI